MKKRNSNSNKNEVTVNEKVQAPWKLKGQDVVPVEMEEGFTLRIRWSEKLGLELKVTNLTEDQAERLAQKIQRINWINVDGVLDRSTGKVAPGGWNKKFGISDDFLEGGSAQDDDIDSIIF